MNLETLRDHWQACTACALRRHCRGVVFGGPYSRGDISSASLILVVGTAPTRADDEAGEAFAGAHGQLLQEMLAQADLRLAYLTNGVGCRPPASQPPKAEEALACAPRLVALRELLQPAGVVFVGPPGEVAWAKGLPSVEVLHPMALLNQGHPTPKTVKLVTGQVAKIRRLLSKVAKAAPKEEPPQSIAHVHDFKVIGQWVGETSEQMLRCDCGELR